MCYVYWMTLTPRFRLCSVACRAASVVALAQSSVAFGQELSTRGIWSEIHGHVDIPVLLALLLSGSLLLILNWMLRRETERRRQVELETDEERERLNAILNRAGVGVVLVNRTSRLFDVNHRWCQMFGYRRREVRGRLPAHVLALNGDGISLEAHFQDVLLGRSATQTQEMRFVRKDGSVFWGLVSTSLVNDKDGRGKWCVAMISDIDLQKRAEEALRESEERLRFITENTLDVVWQLDSECRFTYVNSADERMRGFPRAEVIGQRFTQLLTPNGQAVFVAALQRAKQTDGVAQSQSLSQSSAIRFEVEMLRKDGGSLWADVNCTPTHGTSGEISGYIGVTRDATQHRLAQELLREQTIRDPLTNLFNRRFLDESLERELARAQRDGTPLALLMIDIDHFKQLNDTYGHPAGDEVIRKLGELIRNGARSGDLPCRYGGEEFLLVLPNMTVETAIDRAELWRLQFAKDRTVIGSDVIPATVSIGVAVFPEHGREREALVKAADQALYAAKRDGRNRVAVAS